MSLFKIVIEMEFVVEAPDDIAAYEVAESSLQEAVGNGDMLMIDATEINSMEDLPTGWDEFCLPYGSSDDKTIGDILAAEKDPED